MPKLLRYPDLVERNIVRNRTTLMRWIRDHGFPPGLMIGPNTRAWPEDEIEAWLEARADAGARGSREAEAPSLTHRPESSGQRQ